MTQTRPSPGKSPRSFPFPSLLLLPWLLLAACAPPASEAEGSADIRVALQAVTSADVANITLTISAPDLSPSLVSTLQNAGAGTFKALIGGIPVGTQRTFTAQAFNSANVKIYEGQATGVSISTGAPSQVLLLLQPSTPPTPFVNSAPRLTALTASAAQVKPGQSVTLTATATDVDGDPLSYAWTASGGTFSNASVASPTWTAPAAAGTYTLSVSVTDSRGGQAGVTLTLFVVGERGSASVSASFNAWPVVSQVTGTPGQVAPRGSVNLEVNAVEPDGENLLYSWADDCGGAFNDTSLKNPVWTAPATAPGGGCKVTVTVSDGRGGSTTGRLGLGVGLPSPSNAAPVIDKTYQSNNQFVAGNTVSLSVDASDPEGTALTFAWSATGGTLGTPTTYATHSEVVWTAPASLYTFTITVVVQDAGGQKTTQNFTVESSSQTCIRAITSYKKITTNPYGAAFSVAYSMVGGGGGGNDAVGENGARVSGTFTLGTSPNVEIFVGGGGGYGQYFNGGAGSGGAGYYGGGAGGRWGGGGGTGGGGGSSAILSGGTLVNVAAGGYGAGGYGGASGGGGGGGSTTGGTAGENRYYNVNATAGSLYTGGRNAMSTGGAGASGGAGTGYAGGGGGYGGGGGGSGSGGGGSSGANGGNSTATSGLGANTWATATTLPDAAGFSPANGGGNAGLVILTYTAASCQL